MAKGGSDKMELYWYPMFRSTRVLWLIKELGVEDDFKLTKYIFKHEDAAAHAAYRKDVHPHGTAPALVVPGSPPLKLLESGGICMYLADKYGKRKPGLVPDLKDRADYYDFIMYGCATLDEATIFHYFVWELKFEHSEDKQKTMREKFDSCMEYLAKRLEGRKYLCGDIFTTADIVVGYDIFVAAFLKDGELLKNHPKIKEYYDRLKVREAFQWAIAKK